MSQPSAYVRIYDFDDFQTDNPATPLPADQLEAELNAIVITTNEIRTNMAILQKDDTTMANAVVHPDAFTAASLALMGGSWSPEGAWVTLTVYAVGDVVTNGGVTYVCATAHTAGTFATDLAADKWTALGGSATATVYSNTTSALDADTVQEAIDELALMAGGYLSKSVAGSANVTLTAAEADNTVLKFTGALTGNINVIVPTQERRWVVDNATSGAYTLTVKTSAGTGTAVTQGKKAWLYGDGTNVEKFWSTDDSAVLAANTFTGIQTFGAQIRLTKGGDLASASPLVLGTDGNYFDVTGATGLSAITVAAGTWFVLQFDGALLLTHGASLTMPHAANQTTQAGDEMLCVAVAANTVRVVAYKHATAAAARTALGLGTAAIVNTGVANGNVPAMDATGYPVADGSQITNIASAFKQIGTSTNRYIFGAIGEPSNTATLAVTADRLYAHPFILTASATFTRIGVMVQTLAVGNARLGIYNWSGNAPGTLVLDAGTVDTGTTGEKEVTISKALTPGTYALAVVFSATPTVYRTTQAGFWSAFIMGGAAGGAGTIVSGLYKAHTYAALPDPFGATTDSGTTSPQMWLRVV